MTGKVFARPWGRSKEGLEKVFEGIGRHVLITFEEGLGKVLGRSGEGLGNALVGKVLARPVEGLRKVFEKF